MLSKVEKLAYLMLVKVLLLRFSKHKLTVLEKEDIERVMTMCRKDDALTEQLLYDIRYDNKWKSHYTKEAIFNEDGSRKKKPLNTAGWVNPLRRLCEKVNR